MVVRIVGFWQRWSYMQLVVIRRNGRRSSSAQRDNSAKTLPCAKTRRHDHCWPALDHLWRDEASEVADDDGALLWMKGDAHAAFYDIRFERGAFQHLTPELRRPTRAPKARREGRLERLVMPRLLDASHTHKLGERDLRAIRRSLDSRLLGSGERDLQLVRAPFVGW